MTVEGIYDIKPWIDEAIPGQMKKIFEFSIKTRQEFYFSIQLGELVLSQEYTVVDDVGAITRPRSLKA